MDVKACRTSGEKENASHCTSSPSRSSRSTAAMRSMCVSYGKEEDERKEVGGMLAACSERTVSLHEERKSADHCTSTCEAYPTINGSGALVSRGTESHGKWQTNIGKHSSDNWSMPQRENVSSDPCRIPTIRQLGDCRSSSRIRSEQNAEARSSLLQGSVNLSRVLSESRNRASSRGCLRIKSAIIQPQQHESSSGRNAVKQ